MNVSVCMHKRRRFKLRYQRLVVPHPTASLLLEGDDFGGRRLLAAQGLPTGGPRPPTPPPPPATVPLGLGWGGQGSRGSHHHLGSWWSAPQPGHRVSVTFTDPRGEHSPLCSCRKTQRRPHPCPLMPHMRAIGRSRGFGFQNVFGIQLCFPLSTPPPVAASIWSVSRR